MVDKQIDMLSAALAKNPKAIGFALDSQAAIPPAPKAQCCQDPGRGVRLGRRQRHPRDHRPRTTSLPAACAADKMAELIGGEGDVALVVHDQTSRTGIDRRDGFVNRIKEKHPKINIVTVQYGSGDHLKSTEITKSILQANRLRGCSAPIEGSAIGSSSGAKEMNRESSSSATIPASSRNRRSETVMAAARDPVGIGYKTVEAAVKAEGEKLEKVIDTGFYYYDKSNIDDPKIAPVL